MIKSNCVLQREQINHRHNDTAGELTLMFLDVFLEVEWFLEVRVAVRTGVKVKVMAVHVLLEMVHLS